MNCGKHLYVDGNSTFTSLGCESNLRTSLRDGNDGNTSLYATLRRLLVVSLPRRASDISQVNQRCMHPSKRSAKEQHMPAVFVNESKHNTRVHSCAVPSPTLASDADPHRIKWSCNSVGHLRKNLIDRARVRNPPSSTRLHCATSAIGPRLGHKQESRWAS